VLIHEFILTGHPHLVAHYNQCKVCFSTIPITDVAFALWTILPSPHKKEKKIMFEGFINEHHLFEDVMPVVKLGGSSLLFPPSLLIRRRGPVWSLGCSVVPRCQE
jgi:hypothetical protein